MKRSLIALALISTFAFAGAANANTRSADFTVKINVLATCKFTTKTQDMNFGRVTASAADGTAVSAEATTDLNFQCTEGTAPTIALASSEWKMEGQDPGINDGKKIAYKLYADQARTTEWNETALQTGAADGSVQVIPVYGKVADVGRVAGHFSDTVTVTLTY